MTPCVPASLSAVQSSAASHFFQCKAPQSPDPLEEVIPPSASDNGADASGFCTTSHPHPPSPGTDDVGNKSTEGEVGRKSLPNYGLWKLDALKECLRLAERRQGLRYGPLQDEVLKCLSNAKKEPCVNALLKRAEWLEMLGKDPEWVRTPVGITPEKAKKRQRVSNSTGTKGGARDAGMTKSESYCSVD